MPLVCFPTTGLKHSKFHEHLQESLSLLGKFSLKAFVENERINLNIRILAQLKVPTINFFWNFKYRKVFPVKKIELLCFNFCSKSSCSKEPSKPKLQIRWERLTDNI